MEKAIEIKNLTFTYKEQENVKALSDVTLDVVKGEFLMVLGHSGDNCDGNCRNWIDWMFVRRDIDGLIIRSLLVNRW